MLTHPSRDVLEHEKELCIPLLQDRQEIEIDESGVRISKGESSRI